MNLVEIKVFQFTKESIEYSKLNEDEMRFDLMKTDVATIDLDLLAAFSPYWENEKVTIMQLKGVDWDFFLPMKYESVKEFFKSKSNPK